MEKDTRHVRISLRSLVFWGILRWIYCNGGSEATSSLLKTVCYLSILEAIGIRLNKTGRTVEARHRYPAYRRTPIVRGIP